MQIRTLGIEDFELVKSFGKETLQDWLRVKRDEICYSVINRGTAWYKRLTEYQEIELEIWYQEWLDVTDTLIVPKTPSWIK